MVNKTLFWSFYVSFCTFCASLRLIRPVFTRPKTSIISVNPVILSISSPCFCTFCAFLWLINPFNQRNLRLINDLRSTKAYVRKNNLFMQNKAKFRKVKLNVYKVLTKDYDKKTLGGVGKNKAKQTQTKPNPKRPK